MTPKAPPPVDPYGGRMYDMAALLAAPPEPVPWRAAPLANDGTLTILSGRAGTGKTWVLHELANAVVRGITHPGLITTDGVQIPKTAKITIPDSPALRSGPALIFDAEMGEVLTKMRFQMMGYAPEIHVFDAQGLDLKQDAHRDLILLAAQNVIGAAGGGFIGIDSLRQLCPSSKENEADSMAPVVTWLRWLMRKVKGAGILIHHEGWETGRGRGSSAIADQCDAAWSMHPASDDEDESTLRIRCGGPGQKNPRYCPPPKPLYVKIGASGGIQESSAPVSKADQYREAILAAIEAGPHKTIKSVADACGKADDDKTWKRAFDKLIAEKAIAKSGGGYKPAEPPI